MSSSGGRRRFFLAIGLLVILAVGGYVVVRATGSGAGEAPPPAESAGAAEAGGDVAPAKSGADKKEGEEKDKKAPVPVNVAAVATGPVSSYITATANLVAEDDVKVLAEVEGKIARIFVEEGAYVTRGQTLAILDRDEAEIALNKASLKAANTTMAHQRASRALEENLMSQQDFDKAKMDDEIARQEKNEAQWRLERTSIRAPSPAV